MVLVTFQHLTRFSMSTWITWWGNCKNMQQIEISQLLFELPARLDSQSSPFGSHFFPALVCPQKGIKRKKIFAHFCNLLIKEHEKRYQKKVETHSTVHTVTWVSVISLFQLSLAEFTKVIILGSDTFGNPIFQKGLQN